MLAVAGHLTQQNFRLPGMLSTSADLSFADMPNGLAALSKIPNLGLFQIIAFIGFLEIGVMKQKEGSFPGDMTLGGEPYAWTKFSDEVKEQKRVSQGWRFESYVCFVIVSSARVKSPEEKVDLAECCRGGVELFYYSRCFLLGRTTNTFLY